MKILKRKQTNIVISSANLISIATSLSMTEVDVDAFFESALKI